MPSDHTVTSGETLSQIAQSHGFQNWRLVWVEAVVEAVVSNRGFSIMPRR